MNSVAFEIATIDHVVIRVRDMGPMLAFYRDVLGCALIKHNEKVGLYHLRAGDAMIDLLQVGGMRPPANRKTDSQNMDHVALRLARFDADQLTSYFAGHGIDIGDPMQRFGAAGDGLSVYLHDPEGNQIELKAPAQGQ